MQQILFPLTLLVTVISEMASAEEELEAQRAVKLAQARDGKCSGVTSGAVEAPFIVLQSVGHYMMSLSHA